MAGEIPYFYAVEPRAWTLDRTYRVYVSRDLLAGALVAGQIRDEESFRRMFGEHFWVSYFFNRLLRRKLAERQVRETAYDTINPLAANLLEIDRRNFQIPRSELLHLRFRRKWTTRSPLDVGVIDIRLLDGRKRRLVVLGRRPPEDVIELLRVFAPGLEVTGKATFRELPRETPSSKRKESLILAALMIPIGGLAAGAHQAGWVNDGRFLFYGVIGTLAGFGFLVRYWLWRGVEDSFVENDDPPFADEA